MTLVSAWVRHAGANEELIVVSDSRVTGGVALNHAPKLFRLERNDSVLAYCGPTLVAYPILLQVKASLDAHEETKNRIIDIVDLKSHIEKTIERLRTQIRDLPSKDDTHRSFKFLLAGYSWKYSEFRAWVFKYDIKTKEFNAYSMPRSGRQFVFMSDVDENEKIARAELMRHLQFCGRRPGRILDWEPLKVLVSIINDDDVRDIGGPPQIIKIYKHGNTLPINVLWPEVKFEDGIRCRVFEINHLGRPLLGYEKTRLLTLDLEADALIEPWKIREYADARNYCESKNLRAKLLANMVRRYALKRALQEEIDEIIKRGGYRFEEIQEAIAAHAHSRIESKTVVKSHIGSKDAAH